MYKLLREQQTKYGKATLFRHKSGLQFFNLENDSQLNSFNIAFKTPDTSSKGSPHCLEHLTLCGSLKYPVRDPFMKMLSRSFSNYMNALTGDDLTMYPFSTTVHKDYYNLMNVYLDSVFNPILKKSNFLQECWRLGTNSAGTLEFKGVVYNEMKGVMSDVNSLYYYQHQKSLYKDSIYSNNSGGDPKNITDLTLQDLEIFHREHYKGSNACVYSFGNIGAENVMKVLDQYLAKFGENQDENGIDGGLICKNKWKEPKSVTISGPLDLNEDPNQQHRTSISYLLNNTNDPIVSNTFRVLSDLLIDGVASPMHKALIGSGLGNEYTSTTGYSSSCYDGNISFGLQGVSRENTAKVQERILGTLETVSKGGFAKDRINSVFHQYELALLHKHASFGLNLGFSVQRRFAHGSDIFSALQFKENIENVHELVRKDGYLQEFIKENMIQNNHRLDLVMSPSKDYFEMVQQEEKQRLETTIANLSPAEVEEAKLQEDILTKEQDSNEDLSVLPCLALSDVKANNQIYPVDNIHLEQSLVTFRETITNGISYLKVKFDLSQISDDLLPYLSIFARALTSMGTSKLSHSQFEEEIRLIGSISANVGSLTAPNSLDIEKTYLQFNCYAKDSNINHLYEKLGQALLDANFKDTNTFEMIVKEDLAGLKSSIVDSGSAYAARAAAAHLTESGRKNELLYGFKQISFLEKLVQSNDAHKELEQLEKIRKHLLVAERSAFVVCESPIKSRHIEQLQTLFNEIPRTKDQVSSSTKISALESSTLIGHNMDLGVNYIAQSIKTVPYIHADSPHLMLLSKILTTNYLHRELREKGGAYGGGCSYSPLSGVIQFTTYRDPIGYQRTLDKFRDSRKWALGISNHCGDRELLEAKMEVLKGIDRPLDAAEEGIAEFSSGLTNSQRQEFRIAIINATLKDVQSCALKHLKGKTVACVIGEQVKPE